MKKKIAAMLSTVMVTTVLFAGCGGKKEEAKTSKEFKNTISLAGASTIVPVIDGMKETFTKDKGTWDKINKDFPNKEIKITTTSGGSGEGVKAVLDNTADFGLVSRTVTEDEKKKIKDYKEINLGTDALTISINPENGFLKVKDNITVDEIKKIFSGEYKFWDEVDKSLEHKEIVVVTRDLSGGAHKVFNELVMKDKDVRADVIQAPSMGALASKVIENKYAIGYVSYGLVNQNKGKIAPLKVESVEPSKENILSGKYKISRPLLVIKSGELNDGEKAFTDFMLSKEGQKIVEKLGFIPSK